MHNTEKAVLLKRLMRSHHLWLYKTIFVWIDGCLTPVSKLSKYTLFKTCTPICTFNYKPINFHFFELQLSHGLFIQLFSG